MIAMLPLIGDEHAGDDIGELALSVAGYAGDADDLAGAHGERNVTERDAAPPLGRDPVEDEERRARLDGGFSGGVSSRPHIIRASSPLDRCPRWSRSADHRAVAHHREAAVSAITSPSLWLMKIIPCRAPPWRGARRTALALAGGQRRGRLVEDEDAGAADQRLGDLHALLLAD